MQYKEMKPCSQQIEEHLTTGHHDNTPADSEKNPKHIVLLNISFPRLGNKGLVSTLHQITSLFLHTTLILLQFY